MSKLSHRTAALGIMSALALGTIAAVPASAPGGSPKITHQGTCTMASSSKLSAKHDDGGIQTEFEVDSNRVGQNWNVALRDNGVTVFTGTRTTVAPSGSFTVRRFIPNRAGTDKIVAVAKNAATGESCVARVSI